MPETSEFFTLIASPWFYIVFSAWAMIFALFGLQAGKESKDTLNGVSLVLVIFMWICYLIINWDNLSPPIQQGMLLPIPLRIALPQIWVILPSFISAQLLQPHN